MNKQELNDLILRIKNQKKLSEEELNLVEENMLETTLGLKLYYTDVVENYEGKNIINFRNDNYLYLKENKKYNLKNNKNSNSNILINADNFLALECLKDANTKIDLIYIDPPYNTGNKDSSIRYNNEYIVSNDNLKHSKWLSFMKKRLSLSRELISDNGLIFISIDDKEYAYLKVLMDEIYGEENFLATIVVKSLPNGRVIKKGFARQHEYVLCYTKNYTNNAYEDIKIGIVNSNNETLTPLQRGGNNSLSTERPNRFYPILVSNGKLSMITNEEYLQMRNNKDEERIENSLFNENLINSLDEKYKNLGFEVIWPKDSKNVRRVWQRTFERVSKEIKEGKIIFDLKTNKICSKPLEIKNPTTIMDEKDFAFSNGARLLNDIIGKNEENNPKFGYPKSLGFMEYLINLVQDDQITVLDFFGGSGTTAEAVMNLNKKDGGERRFILVTNNDNNICKEVTLPRIYSLISNADDQIIKNLGIEQIDPKFHKKYSENFKFLELASLNKLDGQFEELFESEEMYMEELNSELNIDLVSKGNK
ncbi:site-specific DNA-methyltransferase [Mesoplasma tabanidae]|uniref:Type III restriction/modification enzyme, mod subunit n=1 Tax=Mesoplasma tabanidae TaxID=219745 RepID=A0A2K8P411_9MOLU|nr:site-specific DNA-methyltransferase [Mesoplasma tabanidae]ATZ21494.1 type III restriction/modification enzyme, mod subunit [Mesoplasma tabanidae]